MARPSSLTEAQKAEITRRSIKGETAYKIGKALGIPESTVRKNIGPKEQIQSAANAIVMAEKSISSLSLPLQNVAFDLLSGLRAISNNLTHAAVLGTENSVRMHTLAKMQLDRATEDPGAIDFEAARDAGGFTRMANDAAHLGMQLVNANKEQMQNAPALPQIDASRLSESAMEELLKAQDAAKLG